MDVKPKSHRRVPQLPDEPHHIHFRSITRFSASELLLPCPGGFSTPDRACKPREQITRLCHTPSPVSASLRTRVSFVVQTAFELLCYLEWLRKPQVLNTVDDFLCILITQHHWVMSTPDFMTSLSDWRAVVLRAGTKRRAHHAPGGGSVPWFSV